MSMGERVIVLRPCLRVRMIGRTYLICPMRRAVSAGNNDERESVPN
jgi:hypothetical protein